jgi:hypothetical protein
MERRPEHDDDEWDVPGEDVWAEMSPLLETRQHGLFQRIDRQRAAYFADVEIDQDGDEDEENANGSVDKGGVANKNAGQGEGRLLSSGFADLSTWCCDALLPARSNLTSSEKRPMRLVAIADQPTVALSLKISPSTDIADLPTAPDLPAVSAPNVSSDPSAGKAFFSSRRKMREALIQFYQRFLRACLRFLRRALQLCKARRPALKGHELLMERMRARDQRGVPPATLLPPPGRRSARQIRLPADRLFS